MRNATPSLMLILVLLAVLYAVTAGRSGGAACAAVRPSLEASPAEVVPGEPFSLHGEGFYGDFICDDTGPPVSSRPAGGRPTDGIRVEFLQGTRTWTLATVASNEGLEFDAGELELPPDATPGEAVMRATSPSADPRMPPPRAETPFLVLERLPETGGSRRGDWSLKSLCRARMFSGGPRGYETIAATQLRKGSVAWRVSARR